MMGPIRDAMGNMRPKTSTRRGRKAAPGVQSLEGRQLLSFAPINPEFQVNTDGSTVAQLTTPDVATAANGDFVVVWQSIKTTNDVDILMRRYSADGTPKTAGNEVVSTSNLSDREPSIAMAPDGRYVVSWTQTNAAGNFDIVAARFRADGTNLGQFTVPTEDVGTLNQQTSDVAMSADGSFGIVWAATNAAGNSDVRYRAYNADGQPITGDLPVAAGTGNEGRPTIARRQGTGTGPGPFQVITWNDDTTGNNDIGYRTYTDAATGGAAQTANVTQTGNQIAPVVAMDSAGNFTIVWNDSSQPDVTATAANFRQFVGANSTPLTATDRTAIAGNIGKVQIAMAANGRFAIAYEDNSDRSIRFIPVTPTGVLEGSRRYDVNHTFELNPQITMSPSGTRLVVVADDSQVHQFDPFARAFQRAQTPADYDGDGKTDQAVYGYGRLGYRPSTGGNDVYVPFGGPQDVALVGDYDGDGKSDLAVYGYGRLAYRPSTGGNDVYIPFGGPQDRAIAGDYDGDGRTDLAVYGYGRLAYRPSSGGIDVIIPFGGPADRIISGDYDGDGKTDVAVYGYGRLAYRPSRGGTDVIVTFGGPQDQAIAGDYDGDGRTDLAVYGYGRLAYRPSSGGLDQFVNYGGPQDAAVAGDYDGDGKTDVAVYGYGRFAALPSNGGPQLIVPFGGPADVPLPLATPRPQPTTLASAASFRPSVASSRLLQYDSALEAVATQG